LGEYAIGQAVTRREDPRLLRGEGRYFDDLVVPGAVHAVMVRSPHAHADIKSVDTRAAAQMPGVLAVLTGADYKADGLGSIPCDMPRKRRDGSPMYKPFRPAIMADRVRYVGQIVAMVVAETAAQARDAAERVEVDYAPLKTIVDAPDAAKPGAPLLWSDCAGNESIYYTAGDEKATDAAFANAAKVVRQKIVIPRITAAAMEPRGAIGVWDPGEGRYTLHTGLQRPFLFRRNIAQNVLKIPETDLRLVTGDIGGSFGLRGSIFPEMIAVLWASKRVGKPVKWLADRTESFAADDHARDNFTDAALALDKDGRFLALRVKTDANLGGFLSFRGAGPPTGNTSGLIGVYKFDAAHVEVSALMTNTSPTSPYRGAGRPEASFVIERLIDIAADEMGIDPVELRRKNMIPADVMPYKTALTFRYDSGAFEKTMDMALHLADRHGYAKRAEESKRRGKLRGIGITTTIEAAAGGEGLETAELRFDPTGTVQLVSGSIHHGQGHETTLIQVLCDRLPVDPMKVRYIQGDTDKVAFGVGTGGSRSATMAGSAVRQATDKIVAKGRKIAAHMLEAAETDVVYENGTFLIAGTDRKVAFDAVVKAAFEPTKIPKGLEPGLYETATFTNDTSNFPNGCHVCEVEVDPDTGTVAIVKYSVVDDVGTVINPLLLDGQVMGAVAQGAGEALMERIVYDEQGQLLTGSFMDYAMPRADDLPMFEIENNPVPTPTNPLGVKGAGEGGTVGALPAVVNAVVDALSPFGVRHIDPPLTPETVWRALRAATASR
jgi:carbon-monoxide dehydrogenase large subunit